MKQYLFIFIILLTVSSCELDDSISIDRTINPPVLSQISVSPDFFNMANTTGTAAFFDTLIQIRATILTPVPRNTTVRFSLFDPSKDEIASGFLYDNGIAPDQSANDGLFNGAIAFKIDKQKIGQYTITVAAENADKGQGNVISYGISVINTSNVAPMVSQLYSPDTVIVPTGTNPALVKVSVTAIDSQGLSDIVSVSLRSLRPDSSVVGVFPMYDDGSSVIQTTFNLVSGDSVASDGRYTLTIPIFSNTQKNTYRDFQFFATDRSGSISNTITKRIFIQ